LEKVVFCLVGETSVGEMSADGMTSCRLGHYRLCLTCYLA